jgi:hypothetical protein
LDIHVGGCGRLFGSDGDFSIVVFVGGLFGIVMGFGSLRILFSRAISQPPCRFLRWLSLFLDFWVIHFYYIFMSIPVSGKVYYLFLGFLRKIFHYRRACMVGEYGSCPSLYFLRYSCWALALRVAFW